MPDEKRVFGMTLEEVGDLKRSVVDWTDHNHPNMKKSDGGSFASALRAGSQVLRSDETFRQVFKDDWCVEE